MFSRIHHTHIFSFYYAHAPVLFYNQYVSDTFSYGLVLTHTFSAHSYYMYLFGESATVRKRFISLRTVSTSYLWVLARTHFIFKSCPTRMCVCVCGAAEPRRFPQLPCPHRLSAGSDSKSRVIRARTCEAEPGTYLKFNIVIFTIKIGTAMWTARNNAPHAPKDASRTSAENITTHTSCVNRKN